MRAIGNNGQRLTAIVGVFLVAVLLGGCQQSREAELKAIGELLALGSHDEATDKLRDILDEDPNDVRANYMLGSTLLQTGQPGKAVWPLRRAAAGEGLSSVQASILLASTLVQSGDFPEALGLLDAALAKDPERAATLVVRANVHLLAENLEQALEDADRLIALEPDSYPAWLARATALERLERYEEAGESARRMYEAAKDGPEETAALACTTIAEYLDEHVLDRKAAHLQAETCAERYPGSLHALQTLVWLDDALELQQSERGTQRLIDAMDVPEVHGEIVAWLTQRLRGAGESDRLDELLLAHAERSNTPESWGHLGKTRRDGGALDAAAEAFTRGREVLKGPERELFTFRLAEIYSLQGRADEALKLADEELSPKGAYRHLVRAAVLKARGDKEKALGAVEAGLEAWPNNVAGRIFAALLSEELGYWQRAISHYREAMRAAPKASDAALRAALLLNLLGEYNDAKQLLIVQGKERPALPEFFSAAGDATRNLKQYEEALRHYRRTTPLMATLGEARVIRDRDGPEAAVRFLEKLTLPDEIRFDPSLVTAWVGFQAESGDLEAALGVVDRASGEHPDASITVLRGTVLTALERLDAAKAAFTLALEQRPGYGAALGGLARILEIRKDEVAAMERYDQAMNAELPDLMSGYHAGRIAYAAGDRVGAEKRFREVLKRSPGVREAANDLAWLLAEEGRELVIAERWARRAVRMDRSDANGWDTLGAVLLAKDEPDEAVAALRMSLELYAPAPDVEYRLALALADSGREEAAREILSELLGRGGHANAQALAARLSGAGNGS